LPSEIFAEKIRGHWLIENQVHWIFNEDKSKIEERQAACLGLY
jgi:predicted transposase YbfD/YdcC